MGYDDAARNVLRSVRATCDTVIVLHVRYDALPTTFLPCGQDKMRHAACSLPSK
jgi:hypothetical protein